MKFLNILKSLIFIYLLLCLALYFLQKSLIFHPTTETPHSFGTTKITNQNTILETVVTNQNFEDVILYFGGNAENVIYTAADFETHFKNQATYLLKYRGYSGASGTPEEQALYSDALTVFDEVVKNHKGKITVVGRSLGSAVATFLAANRAVDQLVLITPFDSIANVAKELFPVFPVDWLLTQKFDSKSRADKIKARTLVIVAEHDEVIPRSRTDALITALPNNNRAVITINAGHNDIDLKPDYHAQLLQFMESN
ncbi:MAG: alpha/beta hydrolase [Xanthomonadales bacterium]|nr:alpha/beta hydrolase [Xanthomonadales bacterium]